jgi:PmbA protein
LSAEPLSGIAQGVVRMALDRGASAAECTVSEGDEFSVDVRLGQVENLKEAGSRGVGVRVLLGKRQGSSYTSDFTPGGLQQMVESALALAAVTTEDPFAGLPDAGQLGALEGDLALYSDEIARLDAGWKIDQAREAEQAALSADPRVTNSEGASFRTHLGRHGFANSLDFAGEYRTSSCSLSVVPVVKEGGAMERDWWYSAARRTENLESPGEVGRKAAERALRRLGARKIETQKAPVIFEPRIARRLVGHLFEALNGDAVFREASFLAGKLGEQIASEHLTLIDDGSIPGLFGTSPFDDEGVKSRRTVVIDRGVLRSYLLNSYTARKLGMSTTGCASRGITGNASVGHGNLFLEKSATPADSILRTVQRGFLVTELIGFGVNIVTGDFSQGATGLWIENGEPAFPVTEVTVAGNLAEMLRNVDVVGDDLDFRGSTASPTLRIREMTISGR